MNRKDAAILIAAARAFCDCPEDKLPNNGITLWRQIVAGFGRAIKVIEDMVEE